MEQQDLLEELKKKFIEKYSSQWGVRITKQTLKSDLDELLTCYCRKTEIEICRFIRALNKTK